MEVLLFFGALVLVSVFAGAPAAYRHWRGPLGGTRDEVQRAHFELFFTEPANDEEGDE